MSEPSWEADPLDPYGAHHRRTREAWRPIVEAGEVVCWRCGRLIEADEAWDLGHDDEDPTRYRGPEHRGECNRRAGALKGLRQRFASPVVGSQDW